MSTNLFSQDFITENNFWCIVSEGGMEQPWIRTSSFKFSGDTTIQQKRYKKLYYSEDEQKKDWKINSLWFERNDSVFKYWPWTSETTLIYDFNIAEKDSFQIDESLTLFVDSIRIKEWGGKMRKHWYFVGGEDYSSKTTIWIEDVGNLNNFTRSSDINITGALTTLLCFSESNELVYQNPQYNDCYINTLTPIIETGPELVNVYVGGENMITVYPLNRNMGIIEVFTIAGCKIVQKQIELTESKINLPLKGTYIYRFITQTGEIQTGKVVVK